MFWTWKKTKDVETFLAKEWAHTDRHTIIFIVHFLEEERQHRKFYTSTSIIIFVGGDERERERETHTHKARHWDRLEMDRERHKARHREGQGGKEREREREKSHRNEIKAHAQNLFDVVLFLSI